MSSSFSRRIEISLFLPDRDFGEGGYRLKLSARRVAQGPEKEKGGPTIWPGGNSIGHFEKFGR
jgi:hypothetical protein